MPIDPNEATDYLRSNLEWESEPQLSSDQQSSLLDYSRSVDASGVSPGGTGYVETYTYGSLNVAVLMGWRWKLAASAEYHKDDEDEIWEHCKQMVAHWSSIVGDLTIGGTASVGGGSFAIPNIAVW